MNTKNADYSVEVDRTGKDEWSDIIKCFNDASLYQTWSYGSILWGENNLSHLVLKKDNEVEAAAQLRILKLPIIGVGCAYLRWGPLWQHRERENNVDTFRRAIHALREEYVVKRGYVLRIIPDEAFDGSNTIKKIIESEGFIWQESVSPYRTFIIDLSNSLSELHKGLKPSWRNNLRKSERNELNVIEGDSDHLYEVFLDIYKEMHSFKKFVEFVNVNEIRLIQKDLCDTLKMRIMVCEYKGEPVSAAVTSALGNRGLGILWATNKKGRDLKASFLLQWRVIEWLKSSGYLWYDLGGINPQKVLGTYRFKAGLAGKCGRDVHFIGQFNGRGKLASYLAVELGDKFRMINRNARLCLNRIGLHYTKTGS